MSERLLPPNASALELTLDAAVEARLGTIEVAVAEAGRPLEAPDGFAPFIAWGRGARFWSRRWPEETRRAFADRQYELKRLIGTLAGIEAHLAYVADAEIVRTVLPPQGFFLGPSFDESDAHWRAFMRGLPEIRIFEPREAGPEANYLGSGEPDDDLGTIGRFLGAEDGEATFFLGAPPAERYEAVLIERGSERPVELRSVTDPRRGRSGAVYELSWAADGGAGFFLDDVESADGFLGGAPREETFRRVSLGFGQSLGEAWNLLAPTSDIQDLKPEIGYFEAADIAGVYLGETFETHFLTPFGSDDHQYWSLRVMKSVEDFAPPGSFLDFDRFGLPDYTAEFMVAVTGEAGEQDAYATAFFAGDAFLGGPNDASSVTATLDAIEAASALRDTVLVEFDAGFRLRDARSFSDLLR